MANEKNNSQKVHIEIEMRRFPVYSEAKTPSPAPAITHSFIPRIWNNAVILSNTYYISNNIFLFMRVRTMFRQTVKIIMRMLYINTGVSLGKHQPGRQCSSGIYRLPCLLTPHFWPFSSALERAGPWSLFINISLSFFNSFLFRFNFIVFVGCILVRWFLPIFFQCCCSSLWSMPLYFQSMNILVFLFFGLPTALFLCLSMANLRCHFVRTPRKLKNMGDATMVLSCFSMLLFVVPCRAVPCVAADPIPSAQQFFWAEWLAPSLKVCFRADSYPQRPIVQLPSVSFDASIPDDVWRRSHPRTVHLSVIRASRSETERSGIGFPSFDHWRFSKDSPHIFLVFHDCFCQHIFSWPNVINPRHMLHSNIPIHPKFS